jgi:hypothetical protein
MASFKHIQSVLDRDIAETIHEMGYDATYDNGVFVLDLDETGVDPVIVKRTSLYRVDVAYRLPDGGLEYILRDYNWQEPYLARHMSRELGHAGARRVREYDLQFEY